MTIEITEKNSLSLEKSVYKSPRGVVQNGVLGGASIQGN